MIRQMEKLIELLNEYEQENLKVGLLADKWEFNGNLHYYSQYQDGLVFTDVDLRIISARYGFIKWLVENEKIDRHKFYDKNILKGFMTLTKEEKADSIIMNLSVQDEPIEFLVSILK